MSEGTGAGYPRIGPLYVKMTTPRTDGGVTLPGARDIFGSLSISSQFKVSLHLTTNPNLNEDNIDTHLFKCELTRDSARNTQYDFFCSETTIPGATFDFTEELGSRQGIIEKFPTRRIYPEFTITLYVDNNYDIIRLFEEWMNYINPVYTTTGLFEAKNNGQGDAKGSENFFRFRYPDTYRRIISVTKFERNFKESPEVSGGKLGNVPSITYRMLDAFPTNITGIPVSYEGSTITKTTITFNYSRYVYEFNPGTL
jgi:hypothetical protein